MNHSPDILLADFGNVRRHTLSLAEPLSDEDCCVQSMPDASPIKWHMAHTTWFFETFILERFEPRFQPHHPAFRVLFNSYYNGIGQKHPRAQRGLVTRPSVQEVLAYRRNVDERIACLLSKGESPDELSALIELGLQHEKQHQELMLTDVKHLLSMNPLNPAYRTVALEPSSAEMARMAWHDFDSGVTEIGYSSSGFCFDNEIPRHRVFTESFSLASRLVGNGEYLAFIEAGGYAEPSLWLSEGWDWVRSNQLAHPFYWRSTDSGWKEFTLYGLQPLDVARPAIHLSYFEADAYARWAGARLPTEAEWERAAATVGDTTASTNAHRLHPVAAAGESGLCQLYGAAWQWTSSSYAPYPGYSPAEGAIGEYNGKFMANQYVLRGSSCATPSRHTRATYRNFFPTSACWQFTGIRLARS